MCGLGRGESVNLFANFVGGGQIKKISMYLTGFIKIRIDYWQLSVQFAICPPTRLNTNFIYNGLLKH